jgi:GNAT superfamily N-acetyltransferase
MVHVKPTDGPDEKLIEVYPATVDRWPDVEAVLAAKGPDAPAGWCSVARRKSHHRLTHSRTIPTVDDVDVWSVVCFVVRVGYRRQGLAHRLLYGAIDYARSRGA